MIHDPVNTNIVYATTFQAVFRSDDRGQTWTRKSAGLPADPSLDLQAVAIDPLSPTVVYAVRSPGKIYKTENRGA